MKTVIQLLLAALVLNATLQAGRVFWRHYAFEDGVREEALFSEGSTPDDVRAGVLERAADLSIVLGPDDVLVTMPPDRTTIDVSYEDGIPLVPRVYTYVHTFHVSADVRLVH